MNLSVKNEKLLQVSSSRNFAAWLYDHSVSLAFSTYQTGKLFLIGTQDKQKLSVSERTFERCMGLWADADGMYMSTIYQLWRLQNIVEKGMDYQGYDALFVPLRGVTTGDVDIHDIVRDERGDIFFVNALFNCVATISETHSFKPVWKPSFISKIIAEDRCHLNGLALKDGKPRYVTAISTSDIHDGWREHRKNGGVVIDMENNTIICEDLSMPHSPRFYDGRLWLHNSGRGEFGYVDMASGKFEAVCFCPGYLRGLSFLDNYAVVALSKPREGEVFSGLALEDELKKQGVSARCGVLVIDIKSGAVLHSLNIEGIVKEIYDVALLRGMIRPMVLGFQNDDIKRVISVEG